MEREIANRPGVERGGDAVEQFEQRISRESGARCEPAAAAVLLAGRARARSNVAAARSSSNSTGDSGAAPAAPAEAPAVAPAAAPAEAPAAAPLGAPAVGALASASASAFACVASRSNASAASLSARWYRGCRVATMPRACHLRRGFAPDCAQRGLPSRAIGVALTIAICSGGGRRRRHGRGLLPGRGWCVTRVARYRRAEGRRAPADTRSAD